MKPLPLIPVLLTLLSSTMLTAAPATSQECPLAQPVGFKKGSLTIAQGSRVVRLQVEVADTPAARAQGLMCRTRLDANAGMLFLFDETSRGSFWMKNTLIPLSIAFMDESWEIVDILDMDVEEDPANPRAYYSPKNPYRYALEVNQGFFVRNGITARNRNTAGAKVTYRPQR